MRDLSEHEGIDLLAFLRKLGRKKKEEKKRGEGQGEGNGCPFYSSDESGTGSRREQRGQRTTGVVKKKAGEGKRTPGESRGARAEKKKLDADPPCFDKSLRTGQQKKGRRGCPTYG